MSIQILGFTEKETLMKKSLSMKRILSFLLTAVMIVSLVAPALASETASAKKSISWQKTDAVFAPDLSARAVKDTADTENKYSADEMVRVSIIMEDEPALSLVDSVDEIADNAEVIAYREKLEAKQNKFASELSANVLGEELDVVWNLTLAANIISANVKYGEIEAIKAAKGVKDVIIENRYDPCVVSKSEVADPNMATSSAMIGSEIAWASGYTGAGSRIAIIDTGADTDHQSLNADAFMYALAKDAETAGVDADEYIESLDLLDAAEIASVWNQLNASKKVNGSAKAYLNAKIAFGVNYVDSSFDITHDNDSQGEHGSHVTGIATGNRYIKNGSKYENALEYVHTQGVAPDAQLLTMKVFGKSGGAYDSDYMSAIEDAIVLGADSINLSLGSGSAGFGFSEDYQDVMDNLADCGAVVAMSAGNAGAWGDGNLPFGAYMYSEAMNFDTMGSPASYTNSFSVASVDNDGATGNYLKCGDDLIFYTETTGYTNKSITTLLGEREYVFLNSVGTDEEFAAIKNVVKGKIAICWRGTTSFYQKAEAAVNAGAIACIIANNQDGTISMDLSDYTKTAPCISVTQADGYLLWDAATPTDNELYRVGKLTVTNELGAVSYHSNYYTMSAYSSWGTPSTLELKPEITAPGGSIYSINGAVKGGKAYELMSGTSMASPQIAGMAAVVAQYIRENGLEEKTGLTARQLAQSLLMSTAEPLISGEYGWYYPVMQQGAGLANVGAAVNTNSFITVGEGSTLTDSYADGKVKVELGDNPDREKEFSFSFDITNFSDEEVKYELSATYFTQDLFSDSGIDFIDQWTAPIGTTSTFVIDGEEIMVDQAVLLWYCDYEGDGDIDADDGQALLDYLVGNRESINDEEYADLDADGDIDTYDAYLFFLLLNKGVATVPAGETVTVDVTVELSDDIDDYDVNGAWLEGYVFIDELTSADGAEGESHSIPVLGYYGSFTESSMFDVGSYLEYEYGLEELPPYMYAASGEDALYNQALTVKYAGDNGEYYFGGNPLGLDEEYLPERNAFNNVKGDKFFKLYFTAIRNAGESQFVAGADDPIALGPVTAAYYYSNSSTPHWEATNYNLTVGSAPSGEENEAYEVALTLAPEYNVVDGAVDWDSLADGATFAIPYTVDNTDPVISDIQYSKSIKDGSESFTVIASDNQYIAGVLLWDYEGNLIDLGFPSENEEPGTGDVEYTLAVDTTEESKFLIEVYDYAYNCAAYKINMNAEELENDVSVDIIEESAMVLKSSETKLNVEVGPWGIADESVTWTSEDEDIATVDEYGIVRGIAVGTTTITATSNADPTKFDTCEVEVFVIPLTIIGALQDEEGTPEMFEWNLETDDTWTAGPELPTDITSFCYDWYNDYGYIQNSTGYAYKVDIWEGTTIDVSANPNGIGVGLDDIDMFIYNNMSKRTNYAAGIYGAYILFDDMMKMPNGFTSGFNFGSLLTSETGATAFTSIAWAGYQSDTSNPRQRNQYFDIFYLTDDAGYVWFVGINPATGNAQYGIFASDNYCDWPMYDQCQYNSFLMGDDGNFYLAHFTGETSEIYQYVQDADTGDFSTLLLCNVGENVWPAALAMVLPNEASETLTTIDAPMGVLAANEANELAKFERNFETKFEIEAEEFDFTEEAFGGLNSTSAVETGEKFITIDVTAKKNGADAASTNGLITVEYDKNTYEYVSTTVNAQYYSVNAKTAGTVKFDYVDLEGIEEGETVATIKLKVLNSKSTDIKITQDEIDNEHPATSETLKPAFPHEHTEIRGYKKETCTEDGYTGDTWCTDCNTMIKAGKVIPAHGHTPVVEGAYMPSPYMMGYTGDTVCAECGEILEKGHIILPIPLPREKEPTKPVEPVEPIEPIDPVDPIDPVEPIEPVVDDFPFVDVNEGDWSYEDVKFAFEEGLMNGTSSILFSPKASTTRAMIVTILYRLEGEPAFMNDCPFEDVEEGSWYEKAVAWAAGEGIVKGYSDTKFGPNDPITREQMAAILFRYAGFKGYDVTIDPNTNFLSYNDFFSVSDYAKEAMEWNLINEFIKGSDNNLNPQGKATREQVAAILHRFCDKFELLK